MQDRKWFFLMLMYGNQRKYGIWSKSSKKSRRLCQHPFYSRSLLSINLFAKNEKNQVTNLKNKARTNLQTWHNRKNSAWFLQETIAQVANATDRESLGKFKLALQDCDVTIRILGSIDDVVYVRHAFDKRTSA